jgi:hypothetical protein
MNCERIQESFLDYQDGRLSPAESAAVRDHLKTCLDCQREWAGLQEISLKLDRLPPVEPSPRLRAQFYAMLETHRRAADSRSPFVLVRSRLDRFFTRLLPARPALQFALACSLLVAGLLVGARYFRAAATAPDLSVARELADLRTRIETMDKLVNASLAKQPTGERLRTVLASSALTESGPVIVNGLLTTLAFDPSVNVRLSALEALYPHADQSAVRTAVASALPREPSPLVQVAMVDFLAATRDPSALSALEDVSRTATYDQAVRTAARRALAQL